MAAKNWWWGRSVSIDLHGCDHSLITDPQAIAIFVNKLAHKLKMKRVGQQKSGVLVMARYEATR